MRRRWLCAIVAVCMFIGGLSGLPDAASAGTYQQWLPMNDGLWGSEVTCLWKSASGSVFAGTAREGVWVTVDQGMKWQWCGQGIAMTGLVTEPVYRRIVCLQGGNGATDPVFAGCDPGLFVSRDEGRTWSATGSELASIEVNTLTFDPATPGRLYAGTADGVWVSSNGGASWSRHDDIMKRVSVLQISFDASMPDAVFAACVSGVFKSVDRGETWRSLSTALTGMTVRCLVQDPKRPAILLAGTPGGIYRSYDSGDHWTLLNPLGSRPSTLAILIDAFDVSSVRAITSQGLIVSSDGGEHWTLAYQAAVPVTCGAWDTSDAPTDAVLGTSRGTLFVKGVQGELRVQNMGFLNVTAVAYDPNVALSYAVRGSSLFSSDGTHPWHPVSPDLGNARVYGIAIDRNEPRLMYGATEYGILRSTDGGVSWIQLAVTPSDVRGRIQAVAIDPTDGRYVYAGHDYGLYRSDKGFKETWAAVGPPSTGAIVGIAVVPTDGRTIYVASASRLWKTMDRCKTWEIVNADLASVGITSLAVSDDGLTLYAGSRNGGLRSADGGITWQTLGSSLQGFLVNSVVPGPAGQLLAGTSAGFFTSRRAEDNAGPMLQVITPADGTTVSSPQITVSGSVLDSGSGLATLLLNGVSVSVAPQGQFAAPATLLPGGNRLVLQAQDTAGNTTEVALTVTYRNEIVLQMTVGSSTMKIVPDRTVMLDSPPVLLSGRTLVAIRPIIEALDGTVLWSAADRKVTVVQGGHTIQLWIDRSSATVDGKSVQIDADSSAVVPKIISGRTMLPLRFIAEALGSQVDWDAATKKITITYPAP